MYPHISVSGVTWLENTPRSFCNRKSINKATDISYIKIDNKNNYNLNEIIHSDQTDFDRHINAEYVSEDNNE